MLKTIKSTKLGKIELRLVQKDLTFHGMADGKVVCAGSESDDVWRRLHDEVGKSSSHYFGFEGARFRFKKFFPEGFCATEFSEEERNYKLKAKSLLDSTAPLEAASSMSGVGGAILKVFQATNMLSPFEMMRVADVLKGPASDAFLTGAARFALGDVAGGLADMAKAAKPHDAAKWTVVTYLPFLWRPETHMYLKPMVTRDFAERVGHRFATDYEPALKPAVYESLLDLTAQTRAAFSDLNPKDNIDLQSLIWVVGDYEESPASEARG